VALGETNTTDAHSSTVDMPPVQEYQVLRRQLARRFTIVAETVAIGDTTVEIHRPRSADELISPKDFEHDERLPYWAELWPSALVLATRLPRLPSSRGRLLELGCGVGLVTALALRAGWDVVATDYYADALQFTELNSLGVAGRLPETRLIDWREMPDTLGEFDAVVGADVLYERPYSALIASAITRTLAPDGVAVLVDPGRVHAPAFTPACEAEGLTVSPETQGGMTIYRVSRSSLPGPA
jgi:predicted nicotinamide N-methyase